MDFKIAKKKMSHLLLETDAVGTAGQESSRCPPRGSPRSRSSVATALPSVPHSVPPASRVLALGRGPRPALVRHQVELVPPRRAATVHRALALPSPQGVPRKVHPLRQLAPLLAPPSARDRATSILRWETPEEVQSREHAVLAVLARPSEKVCIEYIQSRLKISNTYVVPSDFATTATVEVESGSTVDADCFAAAFTAPGSAHRWRWATLCSWSLTTA